jgi:hypothetical protein
METRADRGDDLLDLLYAEEADGGGAGAGEAEALADDDRRELERLRELRGVLREVRDATEAEAPALDDVMAAARARAKKSTPAMAAAGGGLWARVRGWFQVMAAHPAMAAAATVVLVAGTAGVLYVNGHGSAAPESTAPATTQTRSAAVALPGGGRGEAGGDDGVAGESRELEEAVTAPGAGSAAGAGAGSAAGAGTAAGSGSAVADNGLDVDKDQHDEQGAVATKPAPTHPHRAHPHAAHHGAIGGVRFEDATGTETGGGADGWSGGGGAGNGEKGTGASAPVAPTPPPPPPPPPPAPKPAAASGPARRPAPPPVTTTSTSQGAVHEPAPARPAPAAPAAPPADEAPSEAVRPPEKKDKANPTAQAARLTAQARAAARQKDCAKVRSLATQVRALDLSYYRARFAPDPDIGHNCAEALK